MPGAGLPAGGTFSLGCCQGWLPLFVSELDFAASDACGRLLYTFRPLCGWAEPSAWWAAGGSCIS